MLTMSRPDDRRSYIGGPSGGRRTERSDSHRQRTRTSRFDDRPAAGRSSRNDRNDDDMQICDNVSDNGDDSNSRSGRDSRRYNDYGSHSRDSLSNTAMGIAEPAPMRSEDYVVREGVLFPHENYYDFLKKLIESVNENQRQKVQGAIKKELKEVVTPGSVAERRRLDTEMGHRDELYHCDVVITGLPISVFFGSGFGTKVWMAKAAAGKDLMDKCLRIGLVSGTLYKSIGMENTLKPNRRLPDYPQAVRYVNILDKMMAAQSWPWDILLSRDLDGTTIERLKVLFHAVKEEVYGRDMDISNSPTYGIQNSAGGSRHDSIDRGSRFSSSDRRSGGGADMPAAAKASLNDIELKIAQQREELLRRERAREMIEPLDFDGGSAMHQASSTMNSVLGVPWNGPVATSKQHLLPSLMSMNQTMMYGQQQSMMDERIHREQEEVRRKMEEEERLKAREEELKRRMEEELEQKRKQMEDEIRKQVQQEERARLQMTLAQQQMPTSAGSSYYGGDMVLAGQSSQLQGYQMPQQMSVVPAPVDYEMEEIKRLVKETEEKLIVLQQTAQQSTLTAIFESRAFQTVAQLGENANQLDRSQKQQLLRELKTLLSEALPGTTSSSSRKSTDSRERDRSEKEREHRDSRDRGGDRSSKSSRRRSRSRSRTRDRKYIPSSSSATRRSRSPRSRSRSPRRSRGGREDSAHKEIIVQVGAITLRNLTPAEQSRLIDGDIVVAQDMKNGKWTTAKVMKISEKRATLQVGNATWKKPLSELYKEMAPPVVPVGLGGMPHMGLGALMTTAATAGMTGAMPMMMPAGMMMAGLNGMLPGAGGMY